MAKRTRKFVAALDAARQLNLSAGTDAEALYMRLAEAGYQWNSESGAWDNWGAMPSDAPTELIRVRVWAESSIVPLMADGVIAALEQAGLRLLERSQPYPCRPPQQRESRIYLSFQPRWQS